MVEFDYNAAAELFATRKRLLRRQPFGYKRFAQAADDVRRLYESTEYPLIRRAARP
jgi:hypothetical protein